jgi:hypothetical protein
MWLVILFNGFDGNVKFLEDPQSVPNTSRIPAGWTIKVATARQLCRPL